MSETSFNLGINEAKASLARVQREVSEAIIERDKIRNEIRDQRNSSSIVVKEVKTKEEEKISILDQLEIMNKTLQASRVHFEDTTEKENIYLGNIERSIQEKQELERIFLVKTEELKKIDRDIAIKTMEFDGIKKELENVSVIIKKDQDDIKQRITELEKKESYLKEKETYLNEKQISLEKKETDLNLKEKRLEKLKEELLSKK